MSKSVLGDQNGIHLILTLQDTAFLGYQVYLVGSRLPDLSWYVVNTRFGGMVAIGMVLRDNGRMEEADAGEKGWEGRVKLSQYSDQKDDWMSKGVCKYFIISMDQSMIQLGMPKTGVLR